MKSTLFLLFFITCNLEAALSRLKGPAWGTTARLNEQSLLEAAKEIRDAFNSRIDLVYLQYLKDYIRKELVFQHTGVFDEHDACKVYPELFNYNAKFQFNNVEKGVIQFSLEQEASIASYIFYMHVKNENKVFLLKLNEINSLIESACLDCVISQQSTNNLILYVSAAYKHQQ